MIRHADTKPRHCDSCRKIWQTRKTIGSIAAVPPTNATLAQLTGISVRMVQAHSAHLRAHGYLTSDGKTIDGPMQTNKPVPAPAQTPSQWAERAPVHCRRCSLILIALAQHAKGHWYGQIHVRELAALIESSERTVKTHLRLGHNEKIGHSLVASRLVAFKPHHEMTGVPRIPGERRRPDWYILAPDRATAQQEHQEPKQYPAPAPGHAAVIPIQRARCACACGCTLAMRQSLDGVCRDCREDPKMTCAPPALATTAPPF